MESAMHCAIEASRTMKELIFGNRWIVKMFQCNLSKSKRSAMRLPFWATMAGNLLALLLLNVPRTSLADNLFVADNGNNSIWKFNSSGEGTAFAGLSGPVSLTFDSVGNLYVVAFNNNIIWKFNPSGVGTVFTYGLVEPLAIAFDSSGNLYESNLGGYIRVFNPSGGIAQLDISELGMGIPQGLAFDRSSNLYVASVAGAGGDTIWKYNSPGVGTVFASSGLSYPIGLTFDSAGNLCVANWNGNSIWKYNSSGAGTAFASSGLNKPYGLAFDNEGNLYVANSGDGTIAKFDSSGIGTVFASGLNSPEGLVNQSVPEPSTRALLVGCLVALFSVKRR
jgi:sugar lactone lactonase YvrE